jgi:hypothetical protein
MEHLPVYIYIIFGVATLLAVLLFYKAAGNSRLYAMIVLIWLAIQAIASLNGFYTRGDTTPPLILLLVLPPVLLIIALFVTARGRKFIDRLDPAMLTLLHSCRIPVEITLYYLFLHKSVPKSMTFEGGNLDILSGLTAPVIYYFGYVKDRLNKTVLLFWNLLCLGLLINIVITALLSAPTPFQKLAFTQPDIAIRYFPFVWLPGGIVPLVLFSNLALIRSLMFKQRQENVDQHATLDISV